MELSAKARERFCKDCNIPIRLFQEPYFSDRLKLYDRFYKTLEKWEVFRRELGRYPCEQDYFEDYNRVKDAAISDIKNTEAYRRFNEEDMNQYSTIHQSLPNKDIFKASNDKKSFVGIDMRKANFSALHCYDPGIFGGAGSWEEFMGKYTDNRHIVSSKYIRQVILGNCNPRRHITFEKYLMDKVLIRLTEGYISMDRVAYFSNDEIVTDVSDLNPEERIQAAGRIGSAVKEMEVPLKTELFTLHKILGTEGYYKDILAENGENRIEFKGLDHYVMPFVLRRFLGEEITGHDRVFYQEGLLAKFIEVPEIGF